MESECHEQRDKKLGAETLCRGQTWAPGNSKPGEIETLRSEVSGPGVKNENGCGNRKKCHHWEHFIVMQSSLGSGICRARNSLIVQTTKKHFLFVILWRFKFTFHYKTSTFKQRF